MTDVIYMESRLRDGREVTTEKDFQQWLYEYFDKIARDFGGDGNCPSDIFPAIVRVMVEWVDSIHGMGVDQENAETLADAI
jgi:hypothetical protein